ncbi:transposase [Paenibacillus dendritiformis]|nr:transposase [Paenibacillus dendritiformis]WGU97413.1 transposase [Paenibacillus dendritiformis]
MFGKIKDKSICSFKIILRGGHCDASLDECWHVRGVNGAIFYRQSCIPALFALKWLHGFRCPNCRHVRAYVIRTRRLPLYECSDCRHQTPLTAGTILEGSRTSLRKWIGAIWLVSNPKNGLMRSDFVRLSFVS